MPLQEQALGLAWLDFCDKDKKNAME